MLQAATFMATLAGTENYLTLTLIITLLSLLLTATLPDKSAIMEETDQELSRFDINFVFLNRAYFY